ncbi:MAG: hypothetical protein QE285_20905 [Aquabacterium sp.]|nr:hypothetical protein [Aquabacterium sp.]
MTASGVGAIANCTAPLVRQRLAAAWLTLVVLAGCATRADDVQPRATDPATYAGWDCSRLHDEVDAVQQRAADVAYAVDSRVGNNMIALGLGVTVFWPALLAMRPDGLEASELAALKGRYEALRVAAARQSCQPPSEAMAAQRQALLPVVLGDRLVYEERSSAGAPPHQLGMQVTALRRDQIEFQVDLDGKRFAETWQQDLVGNPVLEGRAPLLGWRRLLKPDLTLGQVLYGDLAAADQVRPAARVRGQVVATGPQTIAGRNFDVAVIELFGEAPVTSSSIGGIDVASTRLDGVMAVDRRNGLLLRLELRSANADFNLRRRLLRVDDAVRP